MTKYTTYALSLVVLILAVALFMRGGEVITALIINTTNTTAVTVNITNTAPACENINCYAPASTDSLVEVALIAGGYTQVKCNATCNDNNGWGDVRNYTGSINNQSQTQSACTAANLWCYQNTSCQNYSAKNSTAQYVYCTFNFTFNAANTSKSGTWHGNITAGDWGGLAGSPSVGDPDINVSLLHALGVDSLFAFGARTAVTNDSTTTTGLQIYNYGNGEIDLQVNGSTITCQQGSFSAGYIHLNTTLGSTYDSSYPLNATLCGPDPHSALCGKFNRFNLTQNVSPATAQFPTAPNRTVYGGIGVPTGVNGNCQGTIWFVAMES